MIIIILKIKIRSTKREKNAKCVLKVTKPASQLKRQTGGAQTSWFKILSC